MGCLSPNNDKTKVFGQIAPKMDTICMNWFILSTKKWVFFYFGFFSPSSVEIGPELGIRAIRSWRRTFRRLWGQRLPWAQDGVGPGETEAGARDSSVSSGRIQARSGKGTGVLIRLFLATLFALEGTLNWHWNSLLCNSGQTILKTHLSAVLFFVTVGKMLFAVLFFLLI